MQFASTQPAYGDRLAFTPSAAVLHRKNRLPLNNVAGGRCPLRMDIRAKLKFIRICDDDRFSRRETRFLLKHGQAQSKVLLMHQIMLLPGNMLAYDAEGLQRRREHNDTRRQADQQFCKAYALHAGKS
jgi:hypothetical protein